MDQINRQIQKIEAELNALYKCREKYGKRKTKGKHLPANKKARVDSDSVIDLSNDDDDDDDDDEDDDEEDSEDDADVIDLSNDEDDDEPLIIEPLFNDKGKLRDFTKTEEQVCRNKQFRTGAVRFILKMGHKEKMNVDNVVEALKSQGCYFKRLTTEHPALDLMKRIGDLRGADLSKMCNDSLTHVLRGAIDVFRPQRK